MMTVGCGEHTLTVEGHAGYAPSGQDIVCAAASALVYALAGTLERGGRLARLTLRQGYAAVEGKGDCGREFAMVRQGFMLLGRDFPRCVSIREISPERE